MVKEPLVFCIDPILEKQANFEKKPLIFMLGI